jgi:hypothetical protein
MTRLRAALLLRSKIFSRLIGQGMDFSSGDNASSPDALPEILFDAPLALARPLTIKAREYWMSLCQEKPMPPRDSITPRGMRDFLANIILFDVVETKAERDYSIRVAGTKVEQTFGQLKGLKVRESFPPEIATRWLKIINCMLDRKEPIRASSRIAFKNMHWLRGEVFVAPLGSGDTVESIFVAVDIWQVEQPPGAKRT